jgi:CheY-like chemotaxis protein
MPGPTIVAVVNDLMFQSRLEQGARALGYTFAVAHDTRRIDAITQDAALVIVDLHVVGVDWRAAVSKVKERGLPVLAFGRHTEAALLRQAREAGCDRVVPRSQLVEELPALIGELTAGKPSPG